jgi:hypothetical protein
VKGGIAHNIIPFPKQEPPLDTPESSRECLDLAKMIDEQVSRWSGYSHHPNIRIRHGSVAKLINDDCQPLDHEPSDYFEEAGVGGTMTREEAKARTQYEHRRQILSQWALRSEIDKNTAQNEGLDEFFEIIQNFTERPGVPDEYRFAIRALRRLYVVRERLAVKIGRVSTLDIAPYAGLAARIGDDLT